MSTNEIALISYKDMREMAQDVVKSGMYAMKTTEQALTLMNICQSEGLHPMQALKRYHIISGGRPSMRADAMLADFQRLGGRVKWITRTDEVCEAVFSHEQGGEVTVKWTIEMAKRIGLTKNPVWAYARQMLTARTISEGIRTCLPGVVAGIYTPEEEADIAASRTPDPAPRAPAATVKPASKTLPADPGIVEGPSKAGGDVPSKVVEAEFTPVVESTQGGELAQREQGGGDTYSDQEGANIPDSAHASEIDPARAAAINALPATVPGSFGEQSTLVKAIKKLLPTDEADALSADCKAATSDSSRQAVIQRVLESLRAELGAF